MGGSLSPYILGLVGYGERGGIPYPLRRGIQETETTGKGLSHPSGIYGRARAPRLIYIGRLAYFVIYC